MVRLTLLTEKHISNCLAGAHSWVRKSLGIHMEGEQTGWFSYFCRDPSNSTSTTEFYFPEYIWGVVDTIPDTDFPDIRCKTIVHSTNGSCMVIPREGDMVRLYVQLSDNQVIDSKTGRVDKDRMGPTDIFEAQFLSSISHYGKY
jgi:phenol 2-monooxygenase (NADPH)